MSYSVFDTNAKADQTNNRMFLDPPVTIARYDIHKYPQFDKFTERQMGFFWRPQEVLLTKDIKDFKLLTENEQHIFTSNLKRQIVLDSVQGRAPTAAFSPICSLPELETWFGTWMFFEQIHSRSYTHIIQNVYSDPTAVFNSMMDIAEIVDCAKDISHYYDDLINMNNFKHLKWDESTVVEHDEYAHKRALWLCLMSVNVLEGIRFYVSFACSWAFAELKKMEGNAKIIKFIARDENLHLASTQLMLKLLPQDDPDFVKIAEECKEDSIKLFEEAVDQEIAWAKYLFKDGSMIGLNEQLLCDYVEWIANRRMTAIGLQTKYKGGTNPLPWTQKWISGQDVQVAPQETEITSYTVGAMKKDVGDDSFKGLSL